MPPDATRREHHPFTPSLILTGAVIRTIWPEANSSPSIYQALTVSQKTQNSCYGILRSRQGKIYLQVPEPDVYY